MRIEPLLSLCLVTVFSAPLQAADETLAQRFPLLARLTPPEASLPQGCGPQKGDPPLKGVRNFAITTDPEALAFEDPDILGDNVEAMYFGVYQEKNEIGIFAWAFKNEELAKKFRNKLAAERGDTMRSFGCKKYVVTLWRDQGTTDECWRFFETFLEKQVDQFEAATIEKKGK